MQFGKYAKSLHTGRGASPDFRTVRENSQTLAHKKPGP